MERKNLATCTPMEFLKQTVKLKKSLEKWFESVGIDEIRKRIPKLEGLSATAKKDAIQKQAMQNLSAIIDSACEDNPELTLEVLALACFVEPQNVNDHPMGYYLASLGEMLTDDGVLSFFTSLARLGQLNTL